MPYITQEDRNKNKVTLTNGTPINLTLQELGRVLGISIENGGELQYVLAVALNTYLEQKGLRYKQLEEIMGALTGTLAEFQRCVVTPYEQSKIRQNGEIYTVIKILDREN